MDLLIQLANQVDDVQAALLFAIIVGAATETDWMIFIVARLTLWHLEYALLPI